MLQARIHSLHLQQQLVLQDIDIALRPACWTAVVGPNGAGKSTMLRTLAGLQPCQGDVSLNGQPWSAWRAKDRARALAWLGQGEGGGQDLLVRDVVMLGRLPHQAWLAGPSSADDQAVDAAMRATHSLPWAHRPMGQLSGGERQRVWLARALAVEASWLLMDEPLTHLDPPHQADWLDIVRTQVGAGVAVVSVLHELNMALQADDLVVMAEGRVRFHGAATSTEAHQALIDVFEGRIRLVEVEGQWVALPFTRKVFVS